MAIKRIITSATLLFLLLSVVRAQDIKTNSNDGSNGSGSEKIDSLHILENDKFSYGFGCAMAAGGSISYKAISVGVEGSWSTIKYKQASFDDEDSEGEGGVFDTEDFKLKQKGPRFYIALNF